MLLAAFTLLVALLAMLQVTAAAAAAGSAMPSRRRVLRSMNQQRRVTVGSAARKLLQELDVEPAQATNVSLERWGCT
jgi:hypothetical protein